VNNIRSFLYRNAEHADDLADLDLGTDPAEVLKGAHSVWNQRFEELYKKDFNFARSDAGEELLYGEACKLVRPYKELFKGTITGNDFLFIGEGVLAREGFVPDKDIAGYGREYGEFGYTGRSREFSSSDGLFLSALLNETDLESMFVDWYPARLWGLGYRLKEGKTAIVGPEARLGDLGEKAEGGATLVYGEVMIRMAKSASGGVHLNMGRRSRHTTDDWNVSMGEKSTGGIFINFDVCGKMGENAANGTFIQLGKFGKGANDIGEHAAGAVCVGVENPQYNNHYYSHNVSRYETKYGKDEALKVMLNELARERPFFFLEKKPDILKIKDVARKVDAHVRMNYPRRA